jgi:hypothetical protein
VGTLPSLAKALGGHPRVSRMGVRAYVYLDNARYIEDSLFSTEIVENRSPQCSCSAAARACCGGRKDEGFSLSDKHKLDPLPPLPHFRIIHRSS